MEPEPQTGDSPYESSPRVRPGDIADIALEEVERERQRRKDERAARRKAGRSAEPPTPLQRRVEQVFREEFQSSGRSKVSLDVRDVAIDDASQSAVIKEFVHAEASGNLLMQGRQIAELQLGEISEEAARQAQEKGSQDLRGKRHVLPSNTMRHALNKHGVGNERDPSQEGITADDIARFPEYVNAAGEVSKPRVRRNGSVTIKFTKRVNGTYVVVELLRNDDTLEFFDMWKKKAH